MLEAVDVVLEVLEVLEGVRCVLGVAVGEVGGGSMRSMRTE